ncbi:MAG: chemotaxis protein CheW [Myxococcales bacterium]
MAATKLGRTNQYLTFRLGPETYALDVGNAREIVEVSEVTKIPRTPPWIRGVINLRGTVVPVLDLKLKFDMGVTEKTVNTVVIIVELLLAGDPFVIGVLADAAQEVFELEAKHIEPPPKFGARVDTQYMRGLARRGDAIYIILDIERVFSGGDMSMAQQVSESLEAQTVQELDVARQA